MSDFASSVAFVALVVAAAVFMARLSTEADPVDALTLAGSCIALGYMMGAVL